MVAVVAALAEATNKTIKHKDPGQTINKTREGQDNAKRGKDRQMGFRILKAVEELKWTWRLKPAKTFTLEQLVNELRPEK